MYKIDNYNREMILERYVHDIVGGLHFIETKEMLKDYIIEKKRLLDDWELELEIMRHDPGILSDVYLEEILQGVSNV